MLIDDVVYRTEDGSDDNDEKEEGHQDTAIVAIISEDLLLPLLFGHHCVARCGGEEKFLTAAAEGARGNQCQYNDDQ